MILTSRLPTHGAYRQPRRFPNYQYFLSHQRPDISTIPDVTAERHMVQECITRSPSAFPRHRRYRPRRARMHMTGGASELCGETSRRTGSRAFIYACRLAGKRYLAGVNPLVRAIVGGWQIDTVYSFYYGQSLTTAWSGPDPTGTAYTTSSTPAQVTIRPDYLHDANLPTDQRTVSRWFDVSAFAAPQPGSFGSAAKGVIKGPGINQWDAGIAKNFAFWERAALRWELTATNFFNHPAWSNPSRISRISARLELSAAQAAPTRRPTGRAGIPHGHSPRMVDK